MTSVARGADTDGHGTGGCRGESRTPPWSSQAAFQQGLGLEKGEGVIDLRLIS